jgi:hypothetical protein
VIRVRPDLSLPTVEHTLSKGESAALELKQSSAGALYSRTLFAGAGRQVVIGYKGAKQVGLRFSECQFRAQAGADKLNNVFWLARLYELVACSFTSCDFRPESDAEMREHAIYGNVAAGLLVSGCRFERIGAQAVQTVWDGRESETAFPELRNDSSEIIVEDSIAIGCGREHGAGRAGFAFSFFPGPGEVLVQRCALRSHQRNFVAHGGTWNSYGAIMVSGHRLARIVDVDVDYRNPDRPAIQVENCPEIILRNVHIDEYAVVRIKGCARVVVENCTGWGILEVDGVKRPGKWTGGYMQSPVAAVALPVATPRAKRKAKAKRKSARKGGAR